MELSLLPPVHRLNHPLVGLVRKGPHDEVVEVDEIECTVGGGPLLHG